MPRAPLIQTNECPYHIRNRSNNKDWFYLDSETLWWIFMDVLYEVKEHYGCTIHCFVLMSNHYHLMLSTPRSNLAEAMKYLHREVARRANRRAGRINHFFGGRYKWSLISEEPYFWTGLKYIFRNPVRAGICETVEAYPFSSLNRCDPRFQWDMIDIYAENKPSIRPDIEWLNEAFLTEVETAIQKGLRRREFHIPRLSGRKVLTALDLPYEKGTIT